MVRVALLLFSLVCAAPKRDVVLFVGDSLTAGYGLSPEEAYPALLEKRWRKDGVPLRARNAGVSGATTAGTLENLDWSLAEDVKLVFLCIGANDGLRGLDLEKSRANIAAIVKKARAKGLPVVLAGMKLPPNYGRDYARRFAAVYPAVASEQKLKLLPFLLEGVAGDPKLNLGDGIHPNAAGHRVVARRVDDFLKKEGLLK
jgi:acyl-CoA thioesterase I